MEAQLTGLIDVVDGLFPAPAGSGDAERHYVLVDYAARWLSREPRAGDDAADARFHSLADLDRLDLWDETVRIVREAAARFG